MRLSRLILIALTGFVTLTGGCAGLRPSIAAPAPPRIDPPDLATQPCRLPVLPDGAVTWTDLERVYLERGEALVACDQARRLALEWGRRD